MAKSDKPESENTEASATQRGGTDDFPIVGIGASAGGLEALEQFLGHVPKGSGLAYIVIQHLDPTRPGIMPELLGRLTGMPVAQAEEGMKVAPDCVYVIPSNKDLSILHGVLYLLDPLEARGLRLPIDFFFRALADDRRGEAIGVILSGMGTDGTMGLKAIKELGGLVLAQDPASAKFDGMPRSAIDTGLVDIVASAEDLPGCLIAAHRRPRLVGEPSPPPESVNQSALDKAVILLRGRTGHDFSFYKKSTVYRRIERRMGIHQIGKIAAYVRFLQENPGEIDLLFKELLIGVTSFFRDKASWAYLQGHALPALLDEYPEGRSLRAWVPACSTGEEAYSLAIAFREAIEKIRPSNRFTLQVFATDLDADAIDKARLGLYPANIAADIEPAQLERYFVAEQGGYRVCKEIREMLIFAPQNLLSDPPFTKLDILSCRNLLIYLDAKLQKKLLPLFHYSLNPGGILFLGSAESIGGFADLFAPLDGKDRLYRRIGIQAGAAAIEFPTRCFKVQPGPAETGTGTAPGFNLQEWMDQLILRQFAPAALLVNDKGDIAHVSGRTSKYLELAAGKANCNIHAMAREGLHHELAMALRQALRQGGRIDVKGLSVGANGGCQHLNLSVQAITDPPQVQGMALVVFQDIPAPPNPKADAPGRVRTRGSRTAQHAEELAHAREEIRVLREEMQASQEELRSANEELQSTNEELQSANEELQSTNEELTTSKEELQSLNEELQTVNAELQSKVEELSNASSDMKNLLDSTDIATVFLDPRMRVRRFSSPATRLIKLIPSDIGRPLSDIASDLAYPELQADAQEVLRTLAFSEKAVPTDDGRWYAVKILPYRTLDNRIDGVVITFTDITASKALEAELRRHASPEDFNVVVASPLWAQGAYGGLV
jgi:two-component system CheB/CheR fusion protein